MTATGAGKTAVPALGGVEVTSGVNEHGAGFCTVHALGPDGQPLAMGQLTPDEVRTLALAWLSAAEAADQDAALLRTCRRLELPDRLAAMVVGELRDTRADQ